MPIEIDDSDNEDAANDKEDEEDEKEDEEDEDEEEEAEQDKSSSNGRYPSRASTLAAFISSSSSSPAAASSSVLPSSASASASASSRASASRAPASSKASTAASKTAAKAEPVIITEDGAPLYIVERICTWRRVGRTKHMEYMIKWQGYKESENTWEPRRNLIGMAGRGGRDGVF